MKRSFRKNTSFFIHIYTRICIFSAFYISLKCSLSFITVSKFHSTCISWRRYPCVPLIHSFSPFSHSSIRFSRRKIHSGSVWVTSDEKLKRMEFLNVCLCIYIYESFSENAGFSSMYAYCVWHVSKELHRLISVVWCTVQKCLPLKEYLLFYTSKMEKKCEYIMQHLNIFVYCMMAFNN